MVRALSFEIIWITTSVRNMFPKKVVLVSTFERIVWNRPFKMYEFGMPFEIFRFCNLHLRVFLHVKITLESVRLGDFVCDNSFGNCRCGISFVACR